MIENYDSFYDEEGRYYFGEKMYFGAADPADMTPVAPYIRGVNSSQAIYDVARVALKALQEYPTSKMAKVADKWSAAAGELSVEKVVDTTIKKLKIPDALVKLMGAGMLFKMFHEQTKAGDVVLNETSEKNIATNMAAIYADGAKDIQEAGASDWADVLWSEVERRGGIAERAETISLKSGADEAVDRGKTFLKVGTPIALAAGAIGLYIYLTK